MEGLMPDAKKKGLFSKIETRDDALKAVKDTSMGFFVIAALQAALSFLVGFSVLIDAALYVIGGFFVRRFHSRVAAVALLLLALAGAGVTVANKLGENLGGGNNIFLALIVLWAAVRAVEATFKLHGRFSEKAITVEPPST
jgi:predicted ferric reductase